MAIGKWVLQIRDGFNCFTDWSSKLAELENVVTPGTRVLVAPFQLASDFVAI